MLLWFVLTDPELMKNPAKTRSGRIIGTTNAAAASGEGVDTPTNPPGK